MSALSTNAESTCGIRSVKQRREIEAEMGYTDGAGNVGCGHDEHILLRLDLVKLSQKGIDHLF